MTTKTRTWINQFGEEYAVPASITSQFTDISWGNDCAPSFTHRLADSDAYEGDGYSLWVDHPLVEQREFEIMKRFRIVNDAESKLVLETDDEGEAVTKMLELAPKSVVTVPTTAIDKATPRPWRYELGSETIRSVPTNYWIASMDSHEGMCDTDTNAAFIVKAVNAYDKHEALSKAFDAWYGESSHMCQLADRIRDGRANPDEIRELTLLTNLLNASINLSVS